MRGAVAEHATEGGGELLITYERQLDFLPKLSFLRYQEVPEDSFLIDRDEVYAKS
ncbi:hypothetical protein D3C77_741360 [compost metagenome]